MSSEPSHDSTTEASVPTPRPASQRGKAPTGGRERFAHRVQPTRKPDWIRMELPAGQGFREIRQLLAERSLHTVCQEANCPNLGECWRGGTATLMVLGETCTRGCRFCAVRTGDPAGLLDPDEPRKVAEAVELMGLRYVVLTSVDRDDLPDGGASHFAACVREIKARRPDTLVECLVPDFQGDERSVRILSVDAGLDVFAHNIETTERLTPKVRDKRCGYAQSLAVLRLAKAQNPAVVTKSSIMLGLGETERELDRCFADLREAGVEVLTLGQYLRPSMLHLPVREYVTPARFRALEQRALRYGFAYVAAGPMVRSSYKAAEYYLASRLAAARGGSAAHPH